MVYTLYNEAVFVAKGAVFYKSSGYQREKQRSFWALGLLLESVLDAANDRSKLGQIIVTLTWLC